MLWAFGENYAYELQEAFRPQRFEWRIWPILLPEQQLRVEQAKGSDKLDPKALSAALELALKSGWRQLYPQFRLAWQAGGWRPQTELWSDWRKLAQLLPQRPNFGVWELQQHWQDIQAAEERLPFALPPLLQQLYLYNGLAGGWGPDSGLLALLPNLGRPALLAARQQLETDPQQGGFWRHYPHLIPFLHWGTGVYSLFDSRKPEAPVWAFDPELLGPDEDWEAACWWHSPSLLNWFQYWLETDRYGIKLWQQMYERKGMEFRK